MKQKSLLFSLSGLAAVLLTTTAGCGGGHSSAVVTPTTGRATFSVQWPERTRLVPRGANSVKVSFIQGTTEVRSVLLVRPQDAPFVTTATVNDMPKGNYTVRATAQAAADGTGNPAASVETPITIIPGQNLVVPLTMASTIASVEIAPAIVNLTSIPVTLSAVAKDAQGAMVLGGTWRWDNSNSQVVSVVPHGDTATIQALSPGTATVTLTEVESGKSVTKDFTVIPTGQG